MLTACARRGNALLSLFCLLILTRPLIAADDSLGRIRAAGVLRWGADAEGGGPYVFPDPENPQTMIGFEFELAQYLAEQLGVRAEFHQGQWSALPDLLRNGQIDLILNGYELTPARAARMRPTRPYYVFEQLLLVPQSSSENWQSLATPSRGSTPRVGALAPSSAYDLLQQPEFRGNIRLISYDGNVEPMQDVVQGRLDATVADTPIVAFYQPRYPGLKVADVPRGKGYYVAYARPDDQSLIAALDQALESALSSGKLEAIDQHYGIWNQTQQELTTWRPSEAVLRGTVEHGWEVLWKRLPLLLAGAAMTIFLSCASMPLAIALGLLVAVLRLYGPRWLRGLLTAYVELLRGTPLLLQLYFIFFVLPMIGINLQAVVAAVLGLAINYSAYESEIYRAGLLAIPRGQMEAALALGMAPKMALRRIIVPQAFRLVIPPVTNDFIALFKDTSVCSVITVMELTKVTYIEASSSGATLELLALSGCLYLLMSVPLSHLANRMERRLRSARPATL